MNFLGKIKNFLKSDTKVKHFSSLQSFALIIGNARSGSTVLGSVIDAHPTAIIANETISSANFWRGLNRQDILEEICLNSETNNSSGRISEGYSYSIKQNNFKVNDITVMGDKAWNPATLLLHGDYSLLSSLESALGVPIRIIHAIRNPFDVIATMHTRSTAPVKDRILWYFMHCDSVCAIRDFHKDIGYIDIHHEDLLLEPGSTIKNICNFLEMEVTESHIKACEELLFPTPKETRTTIKWSNEEIEMVLQKMSEFDFLSKYKADNYDNLVS